MNPILFRSQRGVPAPIAAVATEQFGANFEGGSNSATAPGGATPVWALADFAYVRIFNWTGCDWTGIETSAGVYATATLKAAIADIRAHIPGAKLIWCPGGTPNLGAGYATDPTLCPSDPAKFAALIAAVLAVPGIGDELWGIEPRNEVSSTGFFNDTQANLLAQCAAGYAAAKAARPAIHVLTPSVVGPGGPGTLKSYLALGGFAIADAVAVHLYPASATPTVASLVPQLLQLKGVVAGYPTLARGGIYATECGWGNDAGISDHDLQAAFLAQFFIVMLFLGLRACLWYSIQGKAANGNWGTLYDIVGAALTKSGVAIGQVKAWLTAARTASLQITGTIHKATLTTPSGYLGTAIWNIAGGGSYTPLAGTTRFRDIAGNVTAWSSGPVTLDASGKPLLFETRAP